MFCSPNALLYRKIPKCPKTFGHDCRLKHKCHALAGIPFIQQLKGSCAGCSLSRAVNW